MKEVFEKIREAANIQLGEVIKYNTKVSIAFFSERGGELHFCFKYDDTPFYQFICKVTGPDEEVYRILKNELMSFILFGGHLKRIENPIKYLREGMKVGLLDGITC